MSVSSYLEPFARDTEAAITVDWVVLTAAIVALAISAALIIDNALDASSTTLSTNLNSVVSDVLP